LPHSLADTYGIFVYGVRSLWQDYPGVIDEACKFVPEPCHSPPTSKLHYKKGAAARLLFFPQKISSYGKVFLFL
jgi:hypothetical protein